MKRLLAYGAALALALTVGPLVPAPPASASGKVLVKQVATLTGADRIISTQPPTNRRIQRADVEVDVTGQPGSYRYFIGADVLLAEPPNTDELRLILGFGHRSGGTCTIDTWVGNAKTSAANDEYYINGGYNPDYFATPARPWDCVSIALTSDTAPVVIHDQVATDLKNTFHRPKLAVGKVAFLGKNAKRLRLVRGVPTQIEVTVRNRGKVSAGRVRITGRGKGVKVGKVRSATALGPGRATTLSVPVRIRARKARKVRLVVRGGGVVARRVIVVRPVKAPPRPRAGRYRSPDGRVTFAVRKGRIVNWRGTMTTRCGIAPAPFTYTQNTYDFPRRRIPRNGIVQARARGAKYSTSLRLRIAGGKVTRGLFTYAGPGACAASVAFTARRVGR